MEKKPLYLFVATAAVLVVLIGGLYVWQKDHSDSSNSTTASSTTASSTSVDGVTVQGNGNYTVTEVPTGTGASVPAPTDLMTAIPFATSVSADERASINSELASVQATLKTTPTDFDSLVQLGILHKEGGDYAGAVTIWNYVASLYPQNAVTNADLADLYTNFFPDYPKAVAAYEAQIKLDPQDVSMYIDLFDLYTNQYPQGTNDPASILKEGIAANPNSTDLSNALAQYEKQNS